jgi:hypothetical protein
MSHPSGEYHKKYLLGLGVRSISTIEFLKMRLVNSKCNMTLFTHLNSNKVVTPATSNALLLSFGELVELTGTVQPARQVRWLETRGWPFATANGRSNYPRVSRLVFDAKMIGKEPGRLTPEPKFEALDRLWRPA